MREGLNIKSGNRKTGKRKKESKNRRDSNGHHKKAKREVRFKN